MKPILPLLALAALVTLPLLAGDPLPIEERNFVPESGWNREGVGLAYSGFALAGTTAHELTGEWTAGSRHQFGYTVPLYSDGRSRLGDVALNYRWQWVRRDDAGIAPRVTVLLPTRHEHLGGDSSGLQVAVPVSVALGERVALHTSAGATWFRAGGSELVVAERAELRAGRRLSAVLDLSWTKPSAGDALAVVRPGIQMSFDAPGGISIAPGIAAPIVGGRAGVLVFLSVEHAVDR